MNDKINSKIVKRTLNYSEESLEDIKNIKDKLLNHKIVINDSRAIRMALKIAANIDEETLITVLKEIPELKPGKRKHIDKYDID